MNTTARMPRLLVRCALAAGLLAAYSAGAQTILIDLTQTVGAEISSHQNIAGETYQWKPDNSDNVFDLEFGSKVYGTAIDLDGGHRGAHEWYQPGGSGYAYGLIKATPTSGGLWTISAKQDGVGNWVSLGTVTEFSGALRHDDNYGYTASSAESHVTYGPTDSLQISAASYKSCFWLYRDTVNNTVSLNLTAGTPGSGQGDGGDMRGRITLLDAAPASFLVRNTEQEAQCVALGNNTFTFDLTWLNTHDDGFVLGPIAIPEPSTYAAILGMASLGFAAWRRRSRSA